MSLLTINDVGIVSGKISMPLTGMWAADLIIDQADATGFEAGKSVTISGDNFSIKGTVVPDRSGVFLDAVHVLVLAGAAGMAKTCQPRSFMQPGAFVSDVLNAIASDSGETLSTTISQSFQQTNLTAWSVMAQSASWNLRALLKWLQPDYSWRILPDGTLWMGDESWDTATGTFDIIEQRPSEGIYTVGCESPFILPGTSLEDIGHVNRVEHVIEKNRIRSVVSVDLAEGDRGLSASIERMVKAQLAGFDYYALYECQVVSQSGDLATVDVRFVGVNGQKIAGLQRVPVRVAAGMKVQFIPNAKVLLGWDGGNPQLPFVCLGLSSESAQQITIDGSTGVLVKAGGVTVIDASASALKLGLLGTLPFLYVGSVDSMGVPVTNNPAASASIVKGG